MNVQYFANAQRLVPNHAEAERTRAAPDLGARRIRDGASTLYPGVNAREARKLVGNPRDATHGEKAPTSANYFLSDPSKDVSERTDVSEKEPERLKRMIAMHEQCVEEAKDRS